MTRVCKCKSLLKEKYPFVYGVLLSLSMTVRRSYYRLCLRRFNNIDIFSFSARKVSFDVIGRNNTIRILSGAATNHLRIKINGDNNTVIIGKKVEFRGAGDIWIEDNNTSLIIGEKTTFQNVHIALTEDNSKIYIGEDCLFAYDIDIRTGDSHSVVDKVSGKRLNHAKNISIGNHVWVAAHTRILKGVVIPENSVIATGSVVTRKFNEPGSVIAGNPAKVVKRDVNWLRERV